MGNKTPAKIEQGFRKTLGAINPYMCLVDVAVKEMIKNCNKKDIRIQAKEHGYPNIITEHINLSSLSQLVHISHLIYIQSKAEEATRQILSLSRADKSKCKQGSFFDKAICGIHCKKDSSYNPPSPWNNQLTQNYLGIEETLIVDYYRLMRNYTIHGAKDSSEMNDYFNEKFNEDNLNKIKNKFGFTPNTVNNLTENDVYLASIAWQSCIKKLSKKCINIKEDIMPSLLKKYKKHTKKRKQSSIINTLKIEYLLSDKEIEDIITSMVN